MNHPRTAAARGPHPVDRGVGANIRRLRRERGMSQETLSALVGVTFQQLQKYERGANRVSCSRLLEIAAALHVAPSVLLPESEGGAHEHTTIDAFRGLQTRLIAAFEQLTRRQARVLILAAEAMTLGRRG